MGVAQAIVAKTEINKQQNPFKHHRKIWFDALMERWQFLFGHVLPTAACITTLQVRYRWSILRKILALTLHFCLIQCIDGQEVDMNSGEVTAELLEHLGSLIGGGDLDFVSRLALNCEGFIISTLVIINKFNQAFKKR